MKTGVELITEERKKQIEKHKRTVELDVLQNTRGQLSFAASLLCAPNVYDYARSAQQCCPHGWDIKIWEKIFNKPHIERLIIAGAFIGAEIDRLDVIKAIEMITANQKRK